MQLGRRVLQYTPDFKSECRNKKWWPETELNRRHKDFQSSALPTELPGHFKMTLTVNKKINDCASLSQPELID